MMLHTYETVLSSITFQTGGKLREEERKKVREKESESEKQKVEVGFTAWKNQNNNLVQDFKTNWIWYKLLPCVEKEWLRRSELIYFNANCYLTTKKNKV